MMKRFDVFDVVVYYSTCLALGYAVEGYIVLAIEYSRNSKTKTKAKQNNVSCMGHSNKKLCPVLFSNIYYFLQK